MVVATIVVSRISMECTRLFHVVEGLLVVQELQEVVLLGFFRLVIQKQGLLLKIDLFGSPHQAVIGLDYSCQACFQLLLGLH